MPNEAAISTVRVMTFGRGSARISSTASPGGAGPTTSCSAIAAPSSEMRGAVVGDRAAPGRVDLVRRDEQQVHVASVPR
jgi:hypothetical protein